MPYWKSRNAHKKVYRPNGMRYAHGKTEEHPEVAVASAMVAFESEFKFRPLAHNTMIEVIGVTAGYAATVMEIIDE